MDKTFVDKTILESALSVFMDQIKKDTNSTTLISNKQLLIKFCDLVEEIYNVKVDSYFEQKFFSCLHAMLLEILISCGKTITYDSQSLHKFAKCMFDSFVHPEFMKEIAKSEIFIEKMQEMFESKYEQQKTENSQNLNLFDENGNKLSIDDLLKEEK